MEEKERNDTMWKSFQRERRIRAARPPRRFDPSNQEIWAELVKRSEPMDISEPLESPRATHPFSFRLDNNLPDPCASFAHIHEHGASFWTKPNHGPAFWTNPDHGASFCKYPASKF